MKRLIGIAALLALIPSWLGLMGGWHWSLDLFSNFRWQYLIAGALVTVWAIWYRQRGILLLAVLTLLLNALLIGRLAWHPEVSTAKLAGDFSLRVLSQNVLQSNQNMQAVFDHVMASDADVVVLIEVNQQWVVQLAGLKAKYPHVIALPRPDNFGIALYSRIPWTNEQILKLGGADFPAIQVELHHQGHNVVLIGLHAMSPPAGSNGRLRDLQLSELARHVASIRVPVLAVGDFNATPWSAGMRTATAGTLGFRSLIPPWKPTWSVGSPLAIPIDHALATAPLVITGRNIGPDVGSDHRSIGISVGWSEGSR